jgi:hypothetical protein
MTPLVASDEYRASHSAYCYIQVRYYTASLRVYYNLHFTIIGLSLTALSPAAAWYFIIMCVFFALRGKKDTQGAENDQQAKVLLAGVRE